MLPTPLPQPLGPAHISTAACRTLLSSSDSQGHYQACVLMPRTQTHHLYVCLLCSSLIMSGEEHLFTWFWVIYIFLFTTSSFMSLLVFLWDLWNCDPWFYKVLCPPATSSSFAMQCVQQTFSFILSLKVFLMVKLCHINFRYFSYD